MLGTDGHRTAGHREAVRPDRGWWFPGFGGLVRTTDVREPRSRVVAVENKPRGVVVSRVRRIGTNGRGRHSHGGRQGDCVGFLTSEEEQQGTRPPQRLCSGCVLCRGARRVPTTLAARRGQWPGHIARGSLREKRVHLKSSARPNRLESAQVSVGVAFPRKYGASGVVVGRGQRRTQEGV